MGKNRAVHSLGLGVFVGLDCGGSSSRVLAVDTNGNILFQGQSGAANLASTPENRLRRNLAHATQGCPQADYVCGCFAGLVNPELGRRGAEMLTDLFPGASIRAEPDYTAALYASPEGTDICVISGTGSLVCSRSDNRVVKSGGRGYVLGDEGSAFHYGRDAVLRFLDSPQECSAILNETIREVFGTNDEGSIIGQIYRGHGPAALLARLAKALAADAKAGLGYAIESIERNTLALAHVVASHAAQFHAHQSGLEISLAGGTWKIAGMIRDRFEFHLKALLPEREVELHRTMRAPMYGAVELAKEMIHGN